MRFYHLMHGCHFPFFNFFDVIRFNYPPATWLDLFAISCFITGFIAYSKAVASLKRDNGTKRFFDRVTLEESRGRVFQKR